MIGSLIVDIITEAAGAAVRNTQGDTIQKLKASRDKWRARALEWERELEATKTALQAAREEIVQGVKMWEEARDQANAARRERDRYYQELVACRTDAAPITDEGPYSDGQPE